MFFFPLNKKKILVSIIIAFTALIGDKNCELQGSRAASAICDNLTHDLIGIFTWIGVQINKSPLTDLYFMFECLLCGIFASLIDADHFIAAKSLNLADATNLKNRPFMHCTTFVLFITSSLLTISYCLKIHWLNKFGWILTAAFISHHIRDSKKRGFWLWPLGSTPPTPNIIYIISQMLFPQVLSYVFSQLALPQNARTENIVSMETV